MQPGRLVRGASAAPFGFVFQLAQTPDGSFVWNYIAFGERHPAERAIHELVCAGLVYHDGRFSHPVACSDLLRAVDEGTSVSPRIDFAASREVASRFGANLVRERGRAGLSQEDLGLQSSLHRTEIGMLERGARLPRIDTILKVAGALEITPGALLSGMDWQPGNRRLENSSAPGSRRPADSSGRRGKLRRPSVSDFARIRGAEIGARHARTPTRELEARGRRRAGRANRRQGRRVAGRAAGHQ